MAFLTESDQQRIIHEIQQAEKQTSGEIRVHIEPTCKQEPFERAKELFGQLGMHATKEKNGVLFYVAYKDKKFAILGDKGIHDHVTQNFWDEEKEIMRLHFSKGEFCKGICIAIAEAGEKLKAFFPYQSDDSNELSNEISFGGGNDA